MPEGGEAGNENRRRDGDGKGRRSGPGGCLPKSLSISVIQIISKMVRGKIELWKEMTLIGKFVGVWPKERDLVRWIKTVWNPKVHYDM